MDGKRMVARVSAWLLVTGSAAWAQDGYAKLVLSDEPIAYYQFEETDGDFVEDSSGNGFDSVALTNTALDVEGYVGSGVQFAGDGFIETLLTMDPTDPEGDGLDNGLNDFSIELFVMPEPGGAAGAQVFIAQRDGAGLGRSDVIITENGQWGSFLGGGTSDSTVTPATGTWDHLVMTYDGGAGAETMRFYVNGLPAGTGALLAEAADGSWIIGSHKSGASQFFTGRLDEIAFYDYRLDDPDGDDDTSDSRIPAHAEAAFGESQPCNGFVLTCDVAGASILAGVVIEPDFCECETLDVSIDGVLVDTVDFPAQGQIEIEAPDDCEPGIERILRVGCTDGRGATCVFVCPIDDCDILDLTSGVTDGDEPMVRGQFTPPPAGCGCDEIAVAIDGESVGTVPTPADGVLEVPAPADCAPGSQHELSIQCPGADPVSSTFLCPADAGAYSQAVLSDEPVAYYRFEESEGETLVADSSGNEHDSLVVTNVVLGSLGIVGGAARFGGDANIELDLQMDPADSEGDGAENGLNDFTIEAFVMTTLDVANQVFVAQQDGVGLGRSDLLVTGNGTWGTFLGGGTTDSAVVPEVDRWYHVVLTYDGGFAKETIRLYIDGELSGGSALLAEPATGNWIVGSHKSLASQFFTGLVDELAFYDYRLDDPDGDDDVADSRVDDHFEAAFGPSVDCESLTLVCSVTQGDMIDLDVTLTPDGCGCDRLDVFIDDVPAGSIDLLAGAAQVPIPAGCPPGEHSLTLVCAANALKASCTFVCAGGDGTAFVRGDADDSGALNITDGIFILNFLFLGGPNPPCSDSADADDSGAINITDGIFVLNFLFLGGPPPGAPHPNCGLDPDRDDDTVTCDSFRSCP